MPHFKNSIRSEERAGKILVLEEEMPCRLSSRQYLGHPVITLSNEFPDDTRGVFGTWVDELKFQQSYISKILFGKTLINIPVNIQETSLQLLHSLLPT